MEPTEAFDNIGRMESDDNATFSDLSDILNTLGNPNVDMNGRRMPQEAETINNLQQPQTSSTSPPNAMPNLHTLQNVQNKLQKPYIKIVEQPAGKALRFRYECEGRSAGSIPGVNSIPENKTFPTIEIVGYKGDVVVVVSCVTKDPPYRPHPHNLVGKEGCKSGICTLTLNTEPLRASFSNLGIQCVKKKDIKAALDMRESMQVDPFKTKFGHKDQPSSIDLNAVRLCFQAFLKTSTGIKPLMPVVSDPIYDKKAMSDLVICRLCSCSAKVGGGDEIILLCEKVAKDDIKVKFYEISNEGQNVWEDFAEFQQTDIHKQTAIAFKTPRYHNTDILDKAKVFLQLIRPSDGVTSEAIPFEYYPDPDQIKRKRLKTGGNQMNILRRELQKSEQLSMQFQTEFKDVSMANFWLTNGGGIVPDIKTELACSPSNFGSHRSSYQMSPSPQPLSPMNRNLTPSPSPGLAKSLSGSSQSQMCDMFSYNSMASPQQQSKDANRFLSPNHVGDENNFIPVTLEAHRANYNINNNNELYSYDHNAFATSGGSITPIWPTHINANESTIPFQSMNILNETPQQQQQQHQLQQQSFQQHQDGIDVMKNNSSEEGPTLSGLLALVDSDQLVTFNSDELALSNLSIST